MRFRFFTKQKIAFIGASALLLMMISAIAYVYTTHLGLVLAFCAISFGILISYMVLDYASKRKFYNQLIDLSGNLDDKYLLPSIIDNPDFNEGQILYEVLYNASKSMMEQVNNQKRLQEEYREYIEQWVHEIKTPLAAIYLLLENNSAVEDIKKELLNLDGFVQQVLYYARSQAPQRDFFIKKFDLSDVIQETLKKHAYQFIANKIQLKYEIGEAIVFADSKWSGYIIEQIIVNAIKYSTSDHPQISIYGIDNETNYTLIIKDNGIGIPEKDITRIFDKGFTGENGRKFGKSTGMGLYICKSLCDKLYIGIEVESQEHVGTQVSLIFPKSSLF